MRAPILPLRNARVVFAYGPGNLSVDYAASLLRGIERGLLELGARVETFNFALLRPHIKGSAGTYTDTDPMVVQLCEFLERAWNGQRIDLCFGLFHDAYLTPRLQETLERRCSVILNYPLNLLDQPLRFERALRFCTLTLSAEEEAVSKLRERGFDRVQYMPMASDPHIFRPVGSPPEPRALFVGSVYASRHLLLDACSRAIPVSSFGPGQDLASIARSLVREGLRSRRLPPPFAAARMLWRAACRDRRIVSDEEFTRLAAEHGVSLGFADVVEEHTGLVRHKVRLREYESAMCGLCHIAKRLPELQRHFDEGREMLFYDDPAELPGILESLRNGDLAWRNIGAAARRRAERDHTWTARLARVFT